MTKIENSYCVPNNSQWEELIGYAPDRDTVICAVYDAEMGILDANADEVKCLTEIPVPRFLDLMHDRIVPWKLEEIGFQSPVLAKWKYELTLKHVWGEEPFKKPSLRRIRFDKGEMSLDNQPINISKFTDLLSLIRFLTPPPEET